MNASQAELERIGAELRAASTDPHQPVLIPRAGHKDLLDDDDVILPRISIWLYFNPFGPTSCALSWVPLTDSDRLLSLQVENPFQEEGLIYGLVPATMSDGETHEALVSFFRGNGTKEYPLLGDLPSSVLHAGNTPDDQGLSIPVTREDEVRSFFRAVFPEIAGSTEQVRQQCDLFEKYRGAPWERAAKERDDALAAYVPENAHLATDRPREPNTTSSEDPDRMAVFHRWFDLVTDPEHVRSEVEAFESAWVGAMRSASQPPTRPLPAEAQETIRDFVRERVDALLESRLGPELYHRLKRQIDKEEDR